jgi:hypothetical protein
VTFAFDRLEVDYPNFADLIDGGFYQLDANVYQLFVSLWY